MQISDALTFGKKPDLEKLIRYGFTKEGERYVFLSDIMNGMFCLHIHVTSSGQCKFELIDKATDEEYTLIHTPSAVGAFIGTVLAECEDVLRDIIEKCYEPALAHNGQVKLVMQYIREKYGAEAEFLWENAPGNAIFRDEKAGKWFAVIQTVPLCKIGIDGDGTVEILNLKDTPDRIAMRIDGEKYFPGFHMNKKHWYTAVLDGRVPIEEIYTRIDSSYFAVTRQK